MAKTKIFVWGDEVRVGTGRRSNEPIAQAPAEVFANLNKPVNSPIRGRHGQLDGMILAILTWYCNSKGYDPVLSIDADVYFYAKRGDIFTGNYSNAYVDGDEPGRVIELDDIDAWVAEFNIGDLFRLPEPDETPDDSDSGSSETPEGGDDPEGSDSTSE